MKDGLTLAYLQREEITFQVLDPSKWGPFEVLSVTLPQNIRRLWLTLRLTLSHYKWGRAIATSNRLSSDDALQNKIYLELHTWKNKALISTNKCRHHFVKCIESNVDYKNEGLYER